MCGAMHSRSSDELGSIFLNQLMDDMVLVEVGRIPFTYTWFLILISLVGWMEPKYYQGMDVEVVKNYKGV